MIHTIILDSGPLGLLVHQRLAASVTECRTWLARHLSALDIDVILAAQARSLGIPATDYAVATSNTGHLGLMLPARDWRLI